MKCPATKLREGGAPRPVIAYIDDAAGAKSSSSIEPIIVFKLVNLHSLLLV